MFLTGRTSSDINRMTAVGINARRRTDGNDIIDSRTAFQCALANGNIAAAGRNGIACQFSDTDISLTFCRCRLTHGDRLIVVGTCRRTNGNRTGCTRRLITRTRSGRIGTDNDIGFPFGRCPLSHHDGLALFGCDSRYDIQGFCTIVAADHVVAGGIEIAGVVISTFGSRSDGFTIGKGFAAIFCGHDLTAGKQQAGHDSGKREAHACGGNDAAYA